MIARLHPLLALFSALSLFLPAAALGQDSSPGADELLAAALEQLYAEDYPAAEAGFTAALELTESAAGYLGRAQAIFWADGREGEALPDLQRAVELDPSNLDVLTTRYSVRSWLEQAVLGRKELLATVEAHEPQEADMVELCQWSASMDDGPMTERLLELAFEQHGDLTELLIVRAYEAHYYDDLPAARRDLERAVERPDFDPSALPTLAECQLFAGDLAEALATAERAVELTPNNPQAYFVRGRVRNQLDDPEGAAGDLARAKELEPAFGAWDYGEDPDFDASFFEILASEFGFLVLPVLALVLVLGLLALALGGLSEGRREAPDRRGGTQPEYDGEWRELLRIYLVNVGLTLATLGIYRFWAKVRTRRFHYQHTSFAAGFRSASPDAAEGEGQRDLVAGRFDYHATGAEKFTGFLKGIAILAPLAAGLWWLDGRVVEDAGPEAAGAAPFYGFFAVMYLLRPLILVGSQRFNLARTSWNNLRLRFTGKVTEAYGLYARDFLLLILTFGIYWSWHAVRVREFRLRNTKLGEESFQFVGEGSDLFKINFFGTLATYLTLGIYSPWYYAERYRFFVENTRFAGKRWDTDLTGKRVLGVGGTGAIVTLLTLGLGLPWAMTRWRRMKTHATFYRRQVDGEQLASIQDAAASGTLEGLGEAGELLGEIGDLFGL